MYSRKWYCFQVGFVRDFNSKVENIEMMRENVVGEKNDGISFRFVDFEIQGYI